MSSTVAGLTIALVGLDAGFEYNRDVLSLSVNKEVLELDDVNFRSFQGFKILSIGLKNRGYKRTPINRTKI